MHKTLRSTFSKVTMAAVGIACFAPHWPTAAEGPRVSHDCAMPERGLLAFGIDAPVIFEGDAPGDPSVARVPVEPIPEGCTLGDLHEQGDDLFGEGILSYDPLRKRWQ